MIPELSIVIPALNEESVLPILLHDIEVAATVLRVPTEVIVVDGGSEDRTAELSEQEGARVLRSRAGRGLQLHAGACAARGKALLFLHADCRFLPAHGRACLDVLADPAIAAGGFRLAFDSSHPILQLAERLNPLRFALTRVLYGDHGLFLRRTTYEQSGGFPPWPIFEDVGLCRRLRRHGSIVMIDPPMVTSARRFEQHGVLRTYLLMAVLHLLFLLRVSPRKLARLYGYGQPPDKDKNQNATGAAAITGSLATKQS